MLDGLMKNLDHKKGNPYKSDWNYMVEKHYTKLWSLICDQKSTMLEPIHLKIPEKQLFYSKSDKKYLFLGPTWQMYLISEKIDENNRVMVYAPYLFAQGQVFLVPKDLIIRLGYN
tara:strand:- start:1453 stop:1797 length:345 start_codon:yes stop_codon:yes gene_type:complete